MRIEPAEERVESLSDTEHRLAREAANGADIKDARKQEVFKLLFGTAKGKAIEARNALVFANPDDARKIRALQNEVLRYEEMAEWVRTAIVAGENAFAQLQMERGERSDEPEE